MSSAEQTDIEPERKSLSTIQCSRTGQFSHKIIVTLLCPEGRKFMFLQELGNQKETKTAMHRPILRAFVFAIVLNVLSPTVMAGPSLAPAPYQALPVGTVLDYRHWQCTVIANSGIQTICQGRDGSKVRFLGKFVPYGTLPRNGYATRLKGVLCGQIDITTQGAFTSFEPFHSVEIDADSQKAIATLWPLQVGKVVSFRKTFHPAGGSARARIRVTGTKVVKVGGETRTVYVVRGVTRRIRCSDLTGPQYRGFRETWWYDPKIAALVYYDMNWEHSSADDEFFEYKLVSIRIPQGGAAIAIAPPSVVSPTPESPAPESVTPESPTPVSPTPESPAPKTVAKSSGGGTLKLASSGSGFYVSKTGHVLTNRHVVDKCDEVRISGAMSVRRIATGSTVDLALLKADVTKTDFATFRAGRGVRTGEDIIVAGYPLQGLLSSGLTVTKGIVSANIGPKNDQNIIQITAPVQQGNSGGPVLDVSGNIVGVVFSKLNALKFAKITGSLPQNINFAVSAGGTRAFLDGYNVPYDVVPSKTVLHTADIADKARNYTVLVECWK